MGKSISYFVLASCLLISLLAPQDAFASEASQPQRKGIQPSRTSVYFKRASLENRNKPRIIGSILAASQRAAPAAPAATAAPTRPSTVTHTATEYRTITIIRTTVSTVVDTTIINALRETSIYVPSQVTEVAAAETATVYVEPACRFADGFVSVATVNNAPVPEESAVSLKEYLDDFNTVMSQLDVPVTQQTVVRKFVNYTSDAALARKTDEQQAEIMARLKSLCEQGKMAAENPAPFFEKLAIFVGYMEG